MENKPDETVGPYDMPKNHGSRELVPLDADAKAMAEKSLVSVISALKYVYDGVKKDELMVCTRHNCISVAKSDLREVEKHLGCISDQEQKEYLKKNQLLQANMEIARLRDEAGKGVTLEAIGNKLHQMHNAVCEWWRSLGFSYATSKIGAWSNGGYFDFEFSCGMDTHLSLAENKPIAAKKKKADKLSELGQELEILAEDGEYHLLDNENNRAWITAKLKGRFPKCQINRWESVSIHRSDKFHIFHLKVHIGFGDIETGA